MIFYLVIGPPASGKYTIGKVLSQKLDISYIHEHNILDIVSEFDMPNNYTKILEYLNLRLYIARRYLKTSKKDLISTMVVDFNKPLHISFLKKTSEILEEINGTLIIIELFVIQKIRLERNMKDDRLFYKPTKQDIEKSTNKILELDKLTSLNSKKINLEEFGENILHIKVKNEKSKSDAVSKILLEIKRRL